MDPSEAEYEDTAVADFISILEEHRKNCERTGKYVEAEIAKNRLDELRMHEENRRKEAMRSRQIAERLGVEEAHMLEFQQFNHVWDEKMHAYDENAAQLIQQLKVRVCASIFAMNRCQCNSSLKCQFSPSNILIQPVFSVIFLSVEFCRRNTRNGCKSFNSSS